MATLIEFFFPVFLFIIIIGLRQIFNRDNHTFEELDTDIDHFLQNKTILSSVGFNKMVVKSYLDPTINLNFTDLFDVTKYTKEDISKLDLSEIDITELIDNDKINEFQNDLYNNITLSQYYLTYLDIPVYINPYYICSQNNTKKEERPKIAFIGDVPDDIKYKMIKDSIIYNRFTPIQYELNENSFKKFKNIKDMKKVIEAKKYIKKKKELICFGLKFLYDKRKNDFDYSLHFFDYERIGREETSDIPTNRFGMFDTFQNGPDLQSYGIYANGGYNYMMKVVNEYILKNQTSKKYASLSYAVTPMKYIDYKVDPYGQFFGYATVTFILVAYLFPLNIYVYKMVKEKESRIKEGMKIMGLGESEYYLSFLIQYVVVSIFISAINAILYKLVLQEVPFYFVYSLIFLFSLDVFAIAYFCQSFIDKTSISIILSIIIYCIMYCFSLCCMFEDSSFKLKLILSFVPSVNLNLGISLLFRFDFHFRKFYNRDFTLDHFNFSLILVFIMFCVDFLVYTFLGFYLQNVLPHDFGLRKPWYFLCSSEYWCKSHKKRKNINKKDKHEIDEYKIDDSKLTDPSFSHSYEGRPTKDIFKRWDIYRHSSKFENEILYEDKEDDEVFQIRNIVKIFEDGKKAVNGVSLNFYKDEIFALLGHNGAGKTTLISILTGIYESTKGKAIFEGNNVLDSNNINIFRKKLGICPQHDTLFEDLTIREHLEMFSIFKGVPNDRVEDEVNKTLHDFQIENIQNMIARNLSAGDRRKLSIAISLIGGSEVIFLDEPSSGMDITSRRNLWEILKRQCDGKIIILTTHYMEEASVLGKRIGIINQGKMKCLGSPLFLIEKFGRFMSLTVTKEENADNDKIVEFIKSLSKEIEYEILSEEIIFRIPVKDDKNEEKKLKKILDIPNFFNKFDENLNNLNIKSYSVSMPTLEDVFLNFAAEDSKKNTNKSENQLQIQQNVDESILYNQELKHQYTNYEKFKRDFSISMKRRFIMIIRDIKGLLMEIIGPILLVLFGLSISKFQIQNKSKPYLINDLEITGNQIVLFSSLNGKSYEDYFDEKQYNDYFIKFNDTNDYSNCSTKYQYVQRYVQNVYDIYNIYENSEDNEVDMAADDYVGYFGTLLMISEPETPNFEFILSINARVMHSLPIYSHYFLKSIIEKEARKYDPGNEFSIKYTHYPMPYTEELKEKDDIINNAAMIFFVSVAFGIMPANFIAMLVKERVNNSKHLMRVSGMNIFSYWIVNFIYEFLKYYITGGACLFCLYCFDYYKDYVYIMYLIYGPAMICSTYFLSFFFESESNAQNFIILFNLVTGTVGCIIILLFRLLDNTRSFGEKSEYLLGISPAFCFDFAYTIAVNKNQLYSVNYKPEEYNRFTGREMIEKFELMLILIYYCSIGAFIYMILFIIKESRTYSFKQPTKNKLTSNITDKEVIKEIEKTNELKDKFLDNEEEEETNIATNNDIPHNKKIAIKVKNLRKVYSNGCLNKETTTAIDNLNFCIESGECFGLLGLNGAGKTTTFKCITQEISQDNGEIFIFGKDIRGNFNELNNYFGYCPQFNAIFEFLTVYENLEFYATIKGIKQNLIDPLIKNMILEMALTDFTNKIAGRLSGGNKRKLSVAISMLGNPPIILLDEPSTGMDPEARRFMWSVIHKMSKKGRKSSVIMTTHSMDEAETLCKRMGIMVNGEFVCLGTANQIKDEYGYGYECNISIKPLTQEEQLEILSKCSTQIDLKVNNQNLSNILNSLQKQNYLDELNIGRLGERLKKNIDLNGDIHIGTLLNWIFFVENALKFITQGKEYFSKIILSEHIENNFIFKLLKGKESKSIGFFFGLFEKKKDEYHVAEYSIQQTSLEQIFNNFAAKQGKHKEDIQLEENKENGIIIDENLFNKLVDLNS